MKIQKLVVAGLIMSLLLTGCQSGTQSTANKDGSSSTSETADTSKTPEKVKTVSAVTIGEGSEPYYIELLGTVKPASQVKLFPQVPGYVGDIYVQEGQVVHRGDPLMILTGPNGTENSVLIQYRIAALQYQNAEKGLEMTAAGNQVSENIALLQLQSAQNQANGAYTDMEVFNQNIAAAQEGTTILSDSYETTQEKNNRDLRNAREAATTLEDALDSLKDQKRQIFDFYTARINNSTDPSEQVALQKEMDEAILAIEKQRGELEAKLDQAKAGIKTLESASILTENQLQSQLEQAENQIRVLQLNQMSAATKQGLYDGTNDPARLANEGVAATHVKNQATLLQAQAQADVARLNVELLKNQVNGLLVRAPIDGVVGEILVKPGDQAGPQTSLTSMSSYRNFELKVGVDIESAEKLDAGKHAAIRIGGKAVNVRIKSVSPTADATSKLVSVTLDLPNIFFRSHQTLTAQLPLKTTGTAQGRFFVPLDSVTIGTADQFVFVIENGIAVKRDVTLGQIEGSLAEVIQGLQPGDKVIVEGAKQLVGGEKVTISPVSQV